MTFTLIPFILVPLMPWIPRCLAEDWPNGDQSSSRGGVASVFTSRAGQDPAGAAMMAMFGSDTLSKRHTILTAHAVLACLTWAFLVPIGALILRLNVKSPWILRAHVSIQLLSFFSYITAAGLGIYLIQSLDEFSNWMWNDAHPRLGLAILGLFIIQPFLGSIHHKKFKSRSVAQQNDVQQKKLSARTMWGRAHLWLGRILITIGVINGGLGIRLAASHDQLYPSSSNYLKAYIVGVIITILVYFVVIILFEWKRGRIRAQATPRRVESG